MIPVSELIAILTQLPGDYVATVVDHGEDGETFFVPVTDISLRHDTKEVRFL